MVQKTPGWYSIYTMYDAPEQDKVLRLLTTFQIHRATWFTLDFRTSLLWPLRWYLSEKDPSFALMYLWDESLNDFLWRFAWYSDYLAHFFKKTHHKSLLQELWLDESNALKVFTDILWNNSQDEFDRQFHDLISMIRDETVSRKDKVEALDNFERQFFPKTTNQMEIESYCDEIYLKVEKILG